MRQPAKASSRRFARRSEVVCAIDEVGHAPRPPAPGRSPLHTSATDSLGSPVACERVAGQHGAGVVTPRAQLG